MSTLRIQICGPVVIDRDGERLEPGLPGRQGRVLFCFLVVNRDRLVPREEIIEALWPTGGPGNTDAALSSLLSRIRRVIGGAHLGALRAYEHLRQTLADELGIDPSPTSRQLYHELLTHQ